MYLAPEFGNTEVEDPIGPGGTGVDGSCQPGAAAYQQDELTDSHT